MTNNLKKLTTFLMFLSISTWANAYTVEQGDIHDDQGQIVQLRGVNWFGFETSDHVAHGLWTRNWKGMIDQMKSLGFNAVRLPVCPDTLAGAAPGSINASLNPDLVGKNSLEILDAVVNEFDRQGFHVLLDHHRLHCDGGISELWYDNGFSEQRWIADLKFLAGRYRSLPHFLGVDLKNEPHGAATWGAGNALTDWNKAAERAAAEVLSIAPNLLIFVEGVQENPVCSGPLNHWWGGNLEPLQCAPLAIPSNRLVLSPHVYGPDVYNQPYFNVSTFPKNLPAIWEAHFGQFRDRGHVIAIGETGGRYGHGGDAKDKGFQDSLVDYLIGKRIPHVFYWSWNPNSGDTGGILQDDWTHVWTDKMDLLKRLWGQETSPSACSDGRDNDQDGLIDFPDDPGCGSYTDNDEVDPRVPAPLGACQDGIDNDGDGLIDYPNDPGCTSTSDDDEFNPVTTPIETNLPAKVTVSSEWGTGYCAEVSVSNTTAKQVIWKTNFVIQGTVNNLWNAAHVQSDDRIDATGLSWNRTVSPGGTVQFGFCAERSVPRLAACADGQDNDHDGLIDYPADPGCSSESDEDETNETSGGSLKITTTVQSDWGAGYCAEVGIRNPGSSAVVWKIDLPVEGVVNNLWNALYSQQGGLLKASGLDWNKTVPAGGVVQFGFCAQR